MARIRTIKPEFPQSESMGNVSRDARLTFIQLWTMADDSGILRGNSRMLASLLYPYDNDAPELINGWLSELEKENCIIRYKHDGQSYIQILNWLIHQKIDKPTPSKLPSFDSIREDSRGLTIGREGKGEEGIGKDRSLIRDDVADECPHQKIISAYHEILPSLTQVKVWNAKRATQLKMRWREDTKRQNIEYWERLFKYISNSDFLMGRSGKWMADLEWITKSENFVKIIEGKYHENAEE